MFVRLAAVAASVLVAAILSACGGGGSDAAAPVAQPDLSVIAGHPKVIGLALPDGSLAISSGYAVMRLRLN